MYLSVYINVYIFQYSIYNIHNIYIYNQDCIIRVMSLVTRSHSITPLEPDHGL